MSEPFPEDRDESDLSDGASTNGGADWAAVQRAMNLSRFDAWEASGPHRRRVTAELCRGAAGDASQTLTLLGVGPALDLELPRLLERFGTVIAADLDGESLTAGAERQGVSGDPKLKLLAGVELMPAADEPFAGAATGSYLAGLRNAAAPGSLRGTADVAGSLTLLTQLVDRVVRRVGAGHPALPAFAAGVRVGHLRTLADVLNPGGVGLLVTDLFSDRTLPGLADVPADDVPAVVERELARGNVFHGVHPAYLMQTLRTDPDLAPRVARSQCLKPWVWRTDHRAFAVTAVRFRLKGDE